MDQNSCFALPKFTNLLTMKMETKNCKLTLKIVYTAKVIFITQPNPNPKPNRKPNPKPNPNPNPYNSLLN